MHSSRMGGALPQKPLPSSGQRPPPDRDPPGQIFPPDRDPLDSDPHPCTETPLDRPPEQRPCRQTPLDRDPGA